MKSVYSAVRTGSLNTAVCASSLKVNAAVCRLFLLLSSFLFSNNVSFIDIFLVKLDQNLGSPLFPGILFLLLTPGNWNTSSRSFQLTVVLFFPYARDIYSWKLLNLFIVREKRLVFFVVQNFAVPFRTVDLLVFFLSITETVLCLYWAVC